MVLGVWDRMGLAYAVAEIALGRAGAATVAELAATGTAAVLMPYPYHRDRQQQLNAAALADRGGAMVVEDTTDVARNAAALRDSLVRTLADRERLALMQSAAANTKPPDAAEEIARFLAG